MLHEGLYCRVVSGSTLWVPNANFHVGYIGVGLDHCGYDTWQNYSHKQLFLYQTRHHPVVYTSTNFTWNFNFISYTNLQSNDLRPTFQHELTTRHFLCPFANLAILIPSWTRLYHNMFNFYSMQTKLFLFKKKLKFPTPQINSNFKISKCHQCLIQVTPNFPRIQKFIILTW